MNEFSREIQVQSHDVRDALTPSAYDTARETIVRIEFEDVRDEVLEWENDDNIVGTKILYA